MDISPGPPASRRRRRLHLFLALLLLALGPASGFSPRLSSAWPRAPPSTMRMSATPSPSPSPSPPTHLSTRRASLAGSTTAAGLFAAFLLSSSAPAPAWAGVRASSVEEAQRAARDVKALVAAMQDVLKAVTNADWEVVKKLLERKEFKQFESTATTLVRYCLTAEDKTSLGTIRRFGLTADFIITLGGLEAELRAGGVLPPVEGTIEEEDEDENGERSVNRGEALKYARLARAAILDIDKISSTVLPESEQ